MKSKKHEVKKNGISVHWLVLPAIVILFSVLIGAIPDANIKHLGLRDLTISKIVVHPYNAQIIYALTWRETRNSETPVPYVLYKTVDGGNNWHQLSCPFHYESYYLPSFDVVFHPANPKVLYVGNFKGLFRSDNGGETWRQLTDMALFPLVFLPGNPQVIYAGRNRLRINELRDPEMIYTSLDGGETWKPIANFPYKSPYQGIRLRDSAATQAWAQDELYVEKIILDPDDPAASFAFVLLYTRSDMGGVSSADSFIFTSKDWGGHWDRYLTYCARKRYSFSAVAMWFDYWLGKSLVAVDMTKIMCSWDMGKYFDMVHDISRDFPDKNQYVRSFLPSTSPQAGYYAGTTNGLYFSQLLDRGWRLVGLEGYSIQSLAYSDADSALLVGTKDGLLSIHGFPVPDTPQVAIQSPVQGETVWGSAQVKATATNQGEIKQSGICVDNQELVLIEGNNTGRQEISGQWDTRTFSKGFHSLTVWTQNDAGLRGFSTINVNVENVLLELSGQQHWEKAWLIKKKTDYADLTLRIDNRGGVQNLRFKISWWGGEHLFTASDLKNGIYTCLLPIRGRYDHENFTVSAWTEMPYILHGYKDFFLKIR